MQAGPLVRKAALDNASLCAAMWSAHNLVVERLDGALACVGTPPPFYPHVVTTDPDVDATAQARAIAERAERTAGAFFVKDSFRALPLETYGFSPLFEARWIHRAARAAPAALRLRWVRVAAPEALGAWEAAWGRSGGAAPIFNPAFLATPGLTMLAGMSDKTVAAGCIVTAARGMAGLSNVFGDAREAINAAAHMASRRDLVGYESGEALAAAVEAGFQKVGRLVVWMRPHAAPSHHR